MRYENLFEVFPARWMSITGFMNPLLTAALAMPSPYLLGIIESVEA